MSWISVTQHAQPRDDAAGGRAGDDCYGCGGGGESGGEAKELSLDRATGVTLVLQVDAEIAKINDEYGNLAKELRKKLGLPALAVAPVVKEDDKK